VRVSGGRVLTVAEEDIGAARADLARTGIGVEATAAAAWAALPDLAGLAEPVVVVMTGSG
jgi:threonine synthase